MAPKATQLYTLALVSTVPIATAFVSFNPRGIHENFFSAAFATIDSSATSSKGGPSFDYAVTLPESEYSQVLVSELEVAKDLREHWDEHFRDPRQPNADRFSWDPWYVKVGDGKFGTDAPLETDVEPVDGEIEAGQEQIQYSLKRTQTSNFFPEDTYLRLVDDLVDLASSVGLTAVTPPWISLYTNGDMQNFHTDAPHGPLAFVLSLCREGEFVGGETMMLQPKIMEYWRGFDSSRGLECGNVMRYEIVFREHDSEDSLGCI